MPAPCSPGRKGGRLRKDGCLVENGPLLTLYLSEHTLLIRHVDLDGADALEAEALERHLLTPAMPPPNDGVEEDVDDEGEDALGDGAHHVARGTATEAAAGQVDELSETVRGASENADYSKTWRQLEPSQLYLYLKCYDKVMAKLFVYSSLSFSRYCLLHVSSNVQDLKL